MRKEKTNECGRFNIIIIIIINDGILRDRGVSGKLVSSSPTTTHSETGENEAQQQNVVGQMEICFPHAPALRT